MVGQERGDRENVKGGDGKGKEMEREEEMEGERKGVKMNQKRKEAKK